jgi:hypothetical protein
MHPHISNINIFDANKVVVTESDTTDAEQGGSHSVKVEIFGDDDLATTTITIWRESGNANRPPHLVVPAYAPRPLGELLASEEGDSDP